MSTEPAVNPDEMTSEKRGVHDGEVWGRKIGRDGCELSVMRKLARVS
jgi:hypothetical protein